MKIIFRLIIGLLIFISYPSFAKPFADLSQFDFRNDFASVKNGWEFYPDKLINPDESGVQAGKTIVKIPSLWMESDRKHKFGSATYRMYLSLPAALANPAISINKIYSEYRVFIDNDIVYQSPNFNSKNPYKKEDLFPRIIRIHPKKSEFLLTIQVLNYSYYSGGIRNDVLIGSNEILTQTREKHIGLQLFLTGALLLVGFYYIWIFFYRKEMAALYSTLGCILISIKALCTGEMFVFYLFPNISSFALFIGEAVLSCWALLMMILFMRRLFPEETPRYGVLFFILFSSFITLFAAFVPLKHFDILKDIIFFFSISATTYLLFSLVLGVIRGKWGARILLVCFIVFLGSVLVEILSIRSIVDRKYVQVYTAVGTLVFVMGQAVVLARLFAEDYRKAKALSEKLVKLNVLKDDFIENTSHEIKTPLHGIISITESVMQNCRGVLPERENGMLSLVSATARRLSFLVNDVLDLAKLKNNDISLVFNTHDVYDSASFVTEVLKYSIGSKEVTLVIDFPPNCYYVNTDESRLRQVLFNLVGNALKFTECGYVRISAYYDNNKVVINVEDTGIGISLEEQKTLFERFSHSKEGYGGTGLGLHITKKLLEILGSEISVKSEEGAGSTFSFSLPASKEERKKFPEKLREVFSKNILPVKKISQEKHYENESSHRFSVLVVDDNHANRTAVAALLSTDGYLVRQFSSGEEFLLFQEKGGKGDIVILDIMMPGISGFDVLKIIRSKYTPFELPVILVSVKNLQDDIIRGFDSGVNDYLTKPFEPFELKSRVKTLILLKNSVSLALKNESAFLSAQIKPHFIYNVLNTIAGLCQIDPEKAEEMILNLSDYMRGQFDFMNLESFVSAEKELSFVKNYVAIEKVRFGDRVEVVFDADTDLSFQIPPLTIQPLVENALKHGILKKQEGGVVELSIKKESGGYKIRISDTGTGMSEEKANAVLSNELTGKGVGLKNIDKRLRQIYNSGLSIESTLGKGTVVSFFIMAGQPVKQENSDD